MLSSKTGIYHRTRLNSALFCPRRIHDVPLDSSDEN